ncbi:MAG TPA: ABC transporter ATP-binding protein/permease [Firmicutes bacterium]|nr:ABC transporter ATP-binding protein/permease [Bacillota bacterium]
MAKVKQRRPGALIMIRLIALVGSLAWVILLAVLGGVLGFLAAMAVPVLGALGIAKVLGEPVALSYLQIMVLAVACGALRGGLRLWEQYSNHYIAFRLLAALRDRIYQALRLLCPAKLEGRQKGAILSMLTADIETLEIFYAHTISPICIAVLTCLVVLLFVGLYASWYLALAALLGFLLIGVALPLVTSGRLRPSGVAYRREFSAFNGYFLDSVKGVREIVLHNAGPARAQEVDRRSQRLQEQTARTRRASALAAGATDLCVCLSLAAALLAGVGLYLDGQLSLGRTVVGVAAVFGSFGPVIAISALPGNLTQTLASGDRVLDLLEERPAVTPVEHGADFAFQRLDVRDLTFSYGEGPVLRGLSLTARRGEIVGLIGPSGCGKSTLLKLLLRFWEKGGGQILYNGVDVDQCSTKSLLDNATLVSQSTYLFDQTVEENLRLAKPSATQQELEEACRKASIHDFILTLPQGYQTRVGALGDRLSAGERQRLGLARAFLHDGPLLLLDEPTSNVDSLNESIILQAISQHRQDKCILLVSHRASTIAIADRVYAIQDGVAQQMR